MEFIGYVYKTVNNITGQYYFGKREYKSDEGLPANEPYLGSGKRLLENVREYGRENFSKFILHKCNTLKEMNSLESKYIVMYSDNPLCLNHSWGRGFGGAYKRGICKQCHKETVLWKDGICMSCIFKNDNKTTIQEEKYCDICGKITPHYKEGQCMKCVAKTIRSLKWCKFCQKETIHCGDCCYEHRLYLVKNEDKTIDLVFRNSYSDRVLIEDVQKFIKETKVSETPRSVIYSLPEQWEIKCDNQFVELKNILYNKDVTNWLKITYKYSKRKGYERSLVVTTDHPLPVEGGEVKRADELKLGDKLIRVGSIPCNQFQYGEIVGIEKYEYTGRSYDVTTETGYFDINNDILSHNCRSFLTPWTTEGNPSKALNYVEGKGKYYGRFNQGVVTINLPDVGLSANGDMDKFWKILDERLDICHLALQYRHNRLKTVTAKRAPLLWQYGALARLDKDETIEKLLVDNYSTLSLGYAGLYECVKAMLGVSHTTEKGKEFGLQIMQHLNDKCNEWKQKETIGYSLYGTPIESTTYKFAKCLKHRFGKDVFIKLDGKDRDYITNSYHVPVFEEIDAFEKLAKESEFQKLSPGGAISYIETPNLQNNTEAVLQVIKFIYDNIMYAELNTKSDYCQVCGYDGEILIDDNLEWYCPNCGNRDHDTLNVARRTCGYIGSNFWNKGRTQEIKERVLHLDNRDL